MEHKDTIIEDTCLAQARDSIITCKFPNFVHKNCIIHDTNLDNFELDEFYKHTKKGCICQSSYIITRDNNTDHGPAVHDIFLIHVYLITLAQGCISAVGSCIILF